MVKEYQYVKQRDPKYINFQSNELNITGSLTLAAWIYTHSTPLYVGIIAKADSTTWSNNQYFIGLPSTSNLRFGIQKGDGSAEATIVGTTDLDNYLNTWVFVTGVFDSDAQELRLYFNGVQDNTPVSSGVSGIK